MLYYKIFLKLVISKPTSNVFARINFVDYQGICEKNKLWVNIDLFTLSH